MVDIVYLFNKQLFFVYFCDGDFLWGFISQPFNSKRGAHKGKDFHLLSQTARSVFIGPKRAMQP
jgi:hypothetical protein